MNKLKFWRTERSLSQIELSQESGIPRYIIQLIETAVRLPSIDERDKLSDALGVNKDILFPANKNEVENEHHS